VAITDGPFITENRNFYILKNFAPLRLCARKLLIGMNGLAVRQPLSKGRGVKIASRKGAKAQRKMELMVKE
jgi:hypothetical protein